MDGGGWDSEFKYDSTQNHFDNQLRIVLGIDSESARNMHSELSSGFLQSTKQPAVALNHQTLEVS